MDFVGKMVSEFTHQGQGQGQGQQGYGGGGGGYGGGGGGYGGGGGGYGGGGGGYGGGGGNNGPPPVHPPWIAEWDSRDNRWLFVNQQTGERTFNYPGPGGSYGGQQQGNYNQQSYNPTQGSQQKQSGGPGWGMVAGAAALGLGGGLLAEHEGKKIHREWDREEDRLDYDKDRLENRLDYDKDRVENDFDNFPENAAGWVGRKTQEVEDIPQDIDNRVDYDVDRMENRFDNDVAGVERFDGRMDQAYDDGRAEQRYDDDNY